MSQTISGTAMIQAIERFDSQLNLLNRAYEQYFLGFEKREPSELRREVEQLMRRCKSTPIQNTAAKFKLNAIVARYNTMRTYWDRTLREIEEGRYKRDVFKAHLHERERAEKTGGQKEPLSANAASSKNTSKPSDPMQQIFDQYMNLRQKTGESTSGLSVDKLSATLQKQAVAIKQKYNCNSVSFKVTVEDGKTKIKAIPKSTNKKA